MLHAFITQQAQNGPFVYFYATVSTYTLPYILWEKHLLGSEEDKMAWERKKGLLEID